MPRYEPEGPVSVTWSGSRLWAGIGGDAERKWLSEMEQSVETVPTDDSVWAEARRLAQEARRQGLTLPATDLLVAACARVHGLDIQHRDSHFDRLAAVVQPQDGGPTR